MSDMVRALTLIADNNDQGRYFAIVGAAQNAAAHDMGFDVTPRDDYRRMYRDRDRDLIKVVGLAVAGLLAEWLEESEMDEWWKAILADVLQLHSHDVRMALGGHYLPEPDDMEELLPDV